MNFISGPYTSYTQLKEMRDIEDWITREALSGTALAVEDSDTRDDMVNRVIDASLGRNTVIFTDTNQPSIMVKFEPNEWSQHRELYGSGNETHPAFLVDGNIKRFWYGKYPAVRVGGTNYAVSLRGLGPAHTISFDNSLAACVANGAGWHLATNAEWAFVALMSMARGYQARGNTDYGRHHVETSEWGVGDGEYTSGRIGRTLTGSGPVYWSHDATPYGVYDLVGSVWKWVGGLRIGGTGAADGEIQIIPNNDAAGSKRTADAHADNTGDWQSLLIDGTLVGPGTTNALCYTFQDGQITIDNAPDGLSSTSRTRTFSAVDAQVSIPQIMEDLLLSPRSGMAPLGTVYVRDAERLPRRGGLRVSGSNAGLGAMNLALDRGNTRTDSGFAPAYSE